jgi:GNAT superfamily N-acetyltransferase
MTPHQEIVDELARDPLRHIVLLKHLLAYPEHVRIHRVSAAAGTATLVALETSVSPYDRQTYPRAMVAAFISSDHPTLTASLLSYVPRGVGVVFKLSRAADLPPIQSQFTVKRRAAFVSFTSSGTEGSALGVRITKEPSDAILRLFEAQGHDETWLRPLLRSGKAFACVLEHRGDVLSACLAFENYRPVWEVGGVITASPHRRKGFGARVVRAALAELSQRALVPRYQVEVQNKPSIGLAKAVGLAPFLTITHYAHDC